MEGVPEGGLSGLAIVMGNGRGCGRHHSDATRILIWRKVVDDATVVIRPIHTLFMPLRRGLGDSGKIALCS